MLEVEWVRCRRRWKWQPTDGPGRQDDGRSVLAERAQTVSRLNPGTPDKFASEQIASADFVTRLTPRDRRIL